MNNVFLHKRYSKKIVTRLSRKKIYKKWLDRFFNRKWIELKQVFPNTNL